MENPNQLFENIQSMLKAQSENPCSVFFGSKELTKTAFLNKIAFVLDSKDLALNGHDLILTMYYAGYSEKITEYSATINPELKRCRSTYEFNQKLKMRTETRLSISKGLVSEFDQSKGLDNIFMAKVFAMSCDADLIWEFLEGAKMKIQNDPSIEGDIDVSRRRIEQNFYYYRLLEESKRGNLTLLSLWEIVLKEWRNHNPATIVTNKLCVN